LHGAPPDGAAFFWSDFGFVDLVECAGRADGRGGGWTATTTVSEGLFGSHSGEQKKESAISFVAAALQLTESVSNSRDC